MYHFVCSHTCKDDETAKVYCGIYKHKLVEEILHCSECKDYSECIYSGKIKAGCVYCPKYQGGCVVNIYTKEILQIGCSNWCREDWE